MVSEKENKAARMAHENLWKELKISVYRTGPQNLEDLKIACLEEWSKTHTWAMHASSFCMKEVWCSSHHQQRILHEEFKFSVRMFIVVLFFPDLISFYYTLLKDIYGLIHIFLHVWITSVTINIWRAIHCFASEL